MTITEQKRIAHDDYPIEYNILTKPNISYPEEYTLIACKWIRLWHDNDARTILWCLIQWKKYIKDRESIEDIIDLNDLCHTVTEYKLHGKRNPNRKSLGILCKFRYF